MASSRPERPKQNGQYLSGEGRQQHSPVLYLAQVTLFLPFLHKARHVHTYPKSQCSKIDPKDLIAEAKRIGLDGFCLTEHQVLWDINELEQLAGD